MKNLTRRFLDWKVGLIGAIALLVIEALALLAFYYFTT